MMISNHSQRGVGLMEVLIALLLLAIGILGFIALQYRSLEASNESIFRVQAINLARDLAERMRVNSSQLDLYKTETSDATKQKTATKTCTGTVECTAAEIADYDVKQVSDKAVALGMTINMATCQGNLDNRNCIYVAWADTSATNGTDTTACTNGTSYVATSTCIVMESY